VKKDCWDPTQQPQQPCHRKKDKYCVDCDTCSDTSSPGPASVTSHSQRVQKKLYLCVKVQERAEVAVQFTEHPTPLSCVKFQPQSLRKLAPSKGSCLLSRFLPAGGMCEFKKELKRNGARGITEEGTKRRQTRILSNQISESL